jgi:hypothetical protein
MLPRAQTRGRLSSLDWLAGCMTGRRESNVFVLVYLHSLVSYPGMAVLRISG